MPELDLSSSPPYFIYALPLLYLIGSVLASRPGTNETAWRIGRATTRFGLLAAAGVGIAQLAWFRGSVPSSVVAMLVAFIGWVITRFASTYLEGEPRQQAFVRWLLMTLAGSSLVVTASNLFVLAAAWLATSLALQQLLTFYADRPNAQMAAHKKFLVSRAADACLFGAALWLTISLGTAELDELSQLARSGGGGFALQGATMLIVAATLLKSAQLPFHGWLMQVMEAPTPVSALLHAGVVNLGGLVLIRFSDLVVATPAAMVLLVIAGGLTAVLAAMVMSTRVSVKLALAWSTCAQMGFMILQCGLGLFEMALLHLIAHSLYKAHAFLGAGMTVQQTTVRSYADASVKTGFVSVTVSVLAGGLTVWAMSSVVGLSLRENPALLAMAGIVALALTPLFARPQFTVEALVRAVLVPTVVAAAYFGLHDVLHATLGLVPTHVEPLWLALVAFSMFAAMFVARAWLTANPNHPRARALHARFYGGLFLDEWFTRWTLRIWPFRPPANPSLSMPHSHLGGSTR